MFIQATLLGSQEHKTNLQIILSASILDLHYLAAVFFQFVHKPTGAS